MAASSAFASPNGMRLKPAGNGPNPSRYCLLRREPDDGDGAAVEIAVAHDDLGEPVRHALHRVGPFARRLERGLDRLGAGVHGERGFLAGQLAGAGEERAEPVVVEGARDDPQRVRLADQRLDQARMAVAVADRRVGAQHVGVAPPVGVPHMHAFAAAPAPRASGRSCARRNGFRARWRRGLRARRVGPAGHGASPAKAAAMRLRTISAVAPSRSSCGLYSAISSPTKSSSLAQRGEGGGELGGGEPARHRRADARRLGRVDSIEVDRDAEPRRAASRDGKRLGRRGGEAAFAHLLDRGSPGRRAGRAARVRPPRSCARRSGRGFPAPAAGGGGRRRSAPARRAPAGRRAACRAAGRWAWSPACARPCGRRTRRGRAARAPPARRRPPPRCRRRSYDRHRARRSAARPPPTARSRRRGRRQSPATAAIASPSAATSSRRAAPAGCDAAPGQPSFEVERRQRAGRRARPRMAAAAPARGAEEIDQGSGQRIHPVSLAVRRLYRVAVTEVQAPGIRRNIRFNPLSAW